MKRKSDRQARFQCRRTVRLSLEEDRNLVEWAASAGLSVAEYMRRRVSGGRPITARTDEQAIRELRRLGGLLKHNFEVIRQTGRQEALTEMRLALQAIRDAIDALSEQA